LRPLRLELLFGGEFFAFGDVFKVGINLGFLGLFQNNFGKTGFVVNANGCAIGSVSKMLLKRLDT